MKRVKIILGIIIVFSLAFFSIGMVVPEINYSKEVEIDKPLEEVFAIFSNQQLVSEWMPEVQSVTVVKMTPEITGSIFNLVVKDQNKEVSFEQKIIDFEANKKVVLFSMVGGLIKKDIYSFTAKESKTVMHLDANFKSSNYILGCMFPFVKGRLEQQDLGYLQNFKKFVESE